MVDPVGDLQYTSSLGRWREMDFQGYATSDCFWFCVLLKYVEIHGKHHAKHHAGYLTLAGFLLYIAANIPIIVPVFTWVRESKPFNHGMIPRFSHSSIIFSPSPKKNNGLVYGKIGTGNRRFSHESHMWFSSKISQQNQSIETLVTHLGWLKPYK